MELHGVWPGRNVDTLERVNRLLDTPFPHDDVACV